MRNIFLDQRRQAARRATDAGRPGGLRAHRVGGAPGPHEAVEQRELLAAISGAAGGVPRRAGRASTWRGCPTRRASDAARRARGDGHEPAVPRAQARDRGRARRVTRRPRRRTSPLPFQPASSASFSSGTPSPTRTHVWPSRSQVAAGRPSARKIVDRRALGLDRRRVVGRVERVAADDRVGERLAVLLVVDGRRLAAVDLAGARAGRLPAELLGPGRERRRRPARRRAAGRRPPAPGRSRAATANAAASSTVGRAGRGEHDGEQHGRGGGAGERDREPAAAGARPRQARRGRPRAARAARAARASPRPRRGSASPRGAGRSSASASSRVARGHRLDLGLARRWQRAVGSGGEIRHQAIVVGLGQAHREAILARN